MSSKLFLRISALTLMVCLFGVSALFAQTGGSFFDAMKWRMIGPFRGGRTVGAVGVPQQPNVFYIGVNNGGVWKTTDYGRTWQPIFDDQPTGSIGDVTVSPSNPNIVYVATGEGLQRPDLAVGNGMYKSTDAGKTWKHIGLSDAQQIGGICVDANNPDRLFVAALGHPYGPNTERGVYRTLDGGTTWKRVLYIDENTGAIQVKIDPNNPNVIFADLWAGRQGPWENGQWDGPESGLYKSTDGGDTWRKITKGLPTPTENGLSRIGVAIAPTDSKRMYATVDAENGGIYRSDDAGESWYVINNDGRLWSRGDDFAEVQVDPKNKDIVYSANVVTWKSTDGGKNWTGFRGAPGGDDYHRIWINPEHPEIILIAADQGAIITVNGGESWSSWYNQPTAQFYHVSTDNAFPYNVYGGQQESGSVGIASRGNDGQITFREWHPVGVEEYGYVAADPLDPNIIYGGKVTRYDKRTGQTQNIAPEIVRSGKYRFIRTAPVLFSPIDPKTLYFSGNVLFKTQNGGHSWEVISPDLTRETWDIPASVGVYTSDELKKMPRRGVIYTVAPSPVDINTIWAGTDDGLIHVTADGGKNWKNVTPESITSWSKVSIMDAGHFDAHTAYAAVNRIRVDDMKPHIYRTHDDGKTWQEIVNGLPDGPINTVKEDPQQKGLLFAGSETNVFVSFDDGDHWQSLRLNMPATSIRDLVIKDDDVVVGTHGRGFWILDDITPLRQHATKPDESGVILYKPQDAIRVRWSMYPDTPLPPDEPRGQNPPDGAIIDYVLSKDAQGSVSLEILDSKGKVVRSYSSLDKPYEMPDVNVPAYWPRPQQILSGKAGSHRFLWDMHYAPLDLPPSFPISAIPGETAPDPTSPWVMPGTYKVRLTANGKVHEQPLIVKMDPRVTTSDTDLQLQHDLSKICYENRGAIIAAQKELRAARATISEKLKGSKGKTASSLKSLDEKLQQLNGGFSRSMNPTLSSLNFSYAYLFGTLQDADVQPTVQTVDGVSAIKPIFDQVMASWEKLKHGEVAKLLK